MASNVTIIDSRTEWDNLTRRVKEVKRAKVPSVKVGVFGKDGSDLVKYASANEFGTGAWYPFSDDDPRTVEAIKTFPGKVPKKIRIPERSYLRSSVDENRSRINEFVSARFSDFLDGKMSVPKALNLIGLMFSSLVQMKITRGGKGWPPNSAFTKWRKKSSRPLIDTGRLRQSITHEIDR